MVLGLVVGIVLSGFLVKSGTPSDKLQDALLSNPTYLTSMLVIGLFFDALGGFIAGVMNSQARVLNSLVMGITSLGLGFLMQTNSTTPSWYKLATVLLVIPSALIGGLFSKLMPAKKDVSPPPLRS